MTFKILSEKFKKAQKERVRKLNKKEKEFIDPDPDLEEAALEKQPPLSEINKTVQLREALKNLFRQERVDKIIEKENKEKAFEPITQRLEKVEKVIKQNDEIRPNTYLLHGARSFLRSW